MSRRTHTTRARPSAAAVTPAPPQTWPLLHTGRDGCGQPMYLLIGRPVIGEPMQVTDFQHTDGRPITEGEEMRCDSCDAAVTPEQIDQAAQAALAESGGYTTTKAIEAADD